jgi:hypothetical protein
MKRRWSLLFWLSLSPLIGLSWFASTIGVGTTQFVDWRTVGMIAATVVAFVAMTRKIEDKWPAVTALVASVPFGFQALRVLPDLVMLVRTFGFSLAVMVAGSLATIACAIWILAAPPPAPRPPPIAPARVVD